MGTSPGKDYPSGNSTRIRTSFRKSGLGLSAEVDQDGFSVTRRSFMPGPGEAFNRSWLSRFLNSPAGRLFRLVAGAGFLVVGNVYRVNTIGVLAMIWGVFPLSAGAFDICYISMVLGGPFSGKRIREMYQSG
jgi:hypothetical protein